MPAPAVIYGVRVHGKGPVRYFQNHAEAERFEAEYWRQGIEVELYAVTIASWRRLPGRGDDQAAS